MNAQQIAGILIILGFVIFWIGNLYSPPGVYSETDSDLRLQATKAYPSRWILSQALGGIGIAIMTIGLMVMSIHFREEGGPWLTYLPSLLNIVAVILIARYLYHYIKNPVPAWESSERDIVLLAAALLMMAASILYGILILQTGVPNWLGYAAVGYSVLAIGALLLLKPPTFYVMALYFFILLALGIGLLVSA